MLSSKTIIFFILLLCFGTIGRAQFKNEDEVKKQADKYFEDEDYANSFKLYSQLVSTYPKDPTYNFRLGVSMLYNEADKKKAIPYLNIASKTAKDNEKESLFYLGKAYHFNYQFDEAIKLYAAYKIIASASMIKKLQVDREIQACKNGKRLLSNLTELVVLDKKLLSVNDYFRSYNLKDIGGKLLVKPDEFRSAADKKKKDRSIVYLPKSNDQLYFAGYGEKGDNKDIYIVRKLPNGEWSKPEAMGTPINTEFDEDYPFLHPNGKVLYFASKGHNSMGGYDIFKSELDGATNRWKEPINLEFPINSPNDDILFVTDSLEKIAYFATSRQSPSGKIDVLKILTERRPAEFAFISGTVLKKAASQSVASKIKIKNIETGEDVGSFDAKADGSYSLKLPNGGKFIFTVETPGFTTQSEGVTVPTAYTYKPYKQAIGYDVQKLYITNFFDSKEEDENNYKEYLELIEQKSKMNVNAEDFGINPENPLAGTNNNQVALNNNQGKTNTEQSGANAVSNSTNPTQNKNVSTKELIQMAFDDAKELKQSADSLKKDASMAFAVANSKQDQANQKKQEADQIQYKINSETNVTKKQELITEVEKQKDDAVLYAAQSSTANNIAKQLEIDANNKQKEADLNLQYAKALEEADKTKNNKQAITKMEDLQKQLELASKQKSNSNALLENIKADANNKQQELQNAEAKEAQLNKETNDIELEVSNIDKQIAETKDKDLVENLRSQKQEQETDLTDKKKEQETNKNKIISLKEEAETLKSQAEFASTIVNGTSGSELTYTSNNKNESISNLEGVEKKKSTEEKNKVAVNNNEVNENPQKYNNDKNQSNQSVNKENKQEVSNNNQAVENKETISLGNKTNEMTALNPSENKSTALNYNSNQNTNGPASELLNKIQNNFNEEKKLFGAVTYTDANALQLKQQADEKFNIVLNEAKIMEAQLQQINASAANSQKVNDQSQIENLTKQADVLSAQASELRKNAKILTGTDKQNAMNNISDLEKQAVELRYKAVKQQLDTDKNTFISNETTIRNLIAKPENKANATQTQQLAEEAAILTKAAQQLKEEAEADPSVASRIGGLGNADEKQKNALVKQSQALKLLKGNTTENTSLPNGDVTSQIEALNNKLVLEIQASNTALKTLSDANKAEYNFSLAQLNITEKTNNIRSEVKELKTLAQKNMQEAAVELGKASINKNEDAKRSQLLLANQKMEDAINDIKQGENALTGNTAITSNNNQSIENASTQQENTNATNTNTVSASLNGESNNQNPNVATNLEPVTSDSITVNENNNIQQENNPSQNEINSGEVASGNTLTANENRNENNENKQVQNNSENSAGNKNEISNQNGNLNQQQVNEIKNTLEFKQYSSLQNETTKYNDQATKEENQAQLYKNKADENLNRATQLKTDAAVLPEGSEKQEKLMQAETLEEKGSAMKLKADSLQELASNTRSFADSKKQEADAYSLGIDKIKLDNINTIYSNEKTNPANETDINNTTTVNRNYTNYSKPFQDNTLTYDEQLNDLQNKNASPENLRAQSIILSNYLKTIDAEITDKKRQQSTATSVIEKNKVAQDIKLLQAKRSDLKNILATNQNTIKENNTATNANSLVNTNTQNNNLSSNNRIVPTTEGSTDAQKYIGTKGFEIKPSNSYNEDHPIPMNEKLPDGLVFRVQIGAFKNPISLDAFKGLTPVGGETTPQGFIRYQAGLFDKYTNANAVKNDLKKLGYNDAFVVAYLNGKRVNLANALDTLKLQGEVVTTDANATAGITANNNIPVNIQPAANAVTETSQPVQSGNLTTVNGLLFTIQIGVYTNNVSNAQLGNLKPIYREQLTNGTYRYTAGIYSNLDLVKTDRRKVNAIGINDAFVSAYLNGQKIKTSDAIEKVTSEKTIQFPAQQPIIFPGENSTVINNTEPAAANNNTQANSNTENTPTTGIKPFSNGVTQGPAPTSDNGVKSNEEGITFKVQIGAYRKQVPQQISDTWLKVKTWPINNLQVNDLYIYTVGSFTEARFAQKLKEEAISLGITDAFITVFKDGKKLYGAELQKYLTR